MREPRLELLVPRDQPVIVFRRAFNAPARLVFAAWTEPEHLRHWRGPRGFELAACEVDLRVGGGYRYLDGGAERGLTESHDRLDELLSALASRPRERQGR